MQLEMKFLWIILFLFLNVQLNNINLDYQEIISQQQDSLNFINSLIGLKTTMHVIIVK